MYSLSWVSAPVPTLLAREFRPAARMGRTVEAEAAALPEEAEMPQPHKVGKAGPAALGAAGLAPLAIALLVGNATIPSSGSKVVSTDPAAAGQCESGLENFHDCHASYPSGCSPSGKYYCH